MKGLFCLVLFGFLSLFMACGTPKVEREVQPQNNPAKWSSETYAGALTPRHEAAFVRVNDNGYLIGGRGIKPVDVLDLKTNTWSQADSTPIELHHMQPVVVGNEIYVLGALTGPWPDETPVPDIYIFNTNKGSWRKGPAIPEDRRRGAAGCVADGNLIYLLGGIINGHRGGHVKWLDVYSVSEDVWSQLPDAPQERDHFQAVKADGKIVAAAGRTTTTGDNSFGGTVELVDVYDITSQQWSTLPNPIPTPRAGNMALTRMQNVLVFGGESPAHVHAHSEVEVLNMKTAKWSSLDTMIRGRHGTGVIDYQGSLILASGCGNRGGNPELSDLIRYSKNTLN